MTRYSIIYADPPWEFNDKMAGHSFSLDHEYGTQKANWINAVPVKDVTATDAVLFLWARLELFARPDNQISLDGSTVFDGWDIWGNEVSSTVSLSPEVNSHEMQRLMALVP